MLKRRQIAIKLKRWCRSRKPQIIIFIIVIIFCAVFYVHLFTARYREPNLNITRRYVENRLAEALKKDKGSGCNIPHLDPFASDVTQFDEKLTEIECIGQDWVKCYLSQCKVVPEILVRTKGIKCVYRDIIYENDFEYQLDPGTVIMDGNIYTLTKSDHVEITCTGTHTSSFLSSSWKGHAAGFRTTVERKPVPPGREDSFNVLIFAFDSTSKNGFIRGMSETYEYFTKNLNGIILNGYNVLGDGTPAALFPIFTGKTELELPDVRKNMNNKGTFDVKEFIFHKLKDIGYRTAFFEDSPSIGTFQYRFNGFQHQPADHYLRAFLMEVDKDSNWWTKNDNPCCIGGTPQYELMMNLTDQFMQLDGKKFIFTFISDITHDVNMLSITDGAMVEFLETLVMRGVLEDTLVMIMGDHGPRYAKVRDIFQGKLEERLPLMGVLLPEKLKRRRPEIQSVLEQNVDALTTPHDIHATLLDVLDLEQYNNPYKVEGADLPRGMTLLEPIPRNRSCSEAGIEPHWCACLGWHNVSANEPVYRKAVDAFITYINLLTEGVRSQCIPRTLSEIKWVMRQTANKRMLMFAGAKDADGYFGSFNQQFKQDHENYQVKVVVAPGRAIFEATLKYMIKEDKFLVSTREISRTNAYGEEPKCMSEKLPFLNPYCYCKN